MAPGFEVHRDKMQKTAQAMRKELAVLKVGSGPHLLDVAKATGAVGQWDVASELGAQVDSAHRKMVVCFEHFIWAYERLIDDLDRVVANYNGSELASKGAFDRRKLAWTKSDTAMWD